MNKTPLLLPIALMVLAVLIACPMMDPADDQPEIHISKDGSEISHLGTGIDIAGAQTGSYSDTVFMIENQGTGTLYLTGTPTVELIGSYAHLFSIVAPFPKAQLSAGSSTSFTLRFAPTAQNGSGSRTVSASIRNNDANESEYQFELSAFAGKAPEINVKQSYTLLADGGSYTFPTTLVGMDTDVAFAIENPGTDTLNLTGSPDRVNVSGADFSQFTLVIAPPATVVAGGAAFFTVRFSPESDGIKQATLRIANNDADEDPYEFSIYGLGRGSGSLDASFGLDGIVSTDLGASEGCRAIAVQPDGKILAAGATSSGSYTDMILIRYDASGALDTGFGVGGVARDVGGWTTSMCLQADGRILLGGYVNNGNDNDFRLIRYTSGGVLDADFGAGGVVTTQLSGAGDYCNSIAVQTDGKIVAAGYAWAIYKRDFAVVRYNPDGSLDSGFGTGGIVFTDLGGEEMGEELAVHPEGGIVLVGQKDMDYILLRYTSGGLLDPDFGSGGIVTTDYGGGSDGARSICMRSDGRFVVCGYSSGNFAVARYLANGSLDPSFGRFGKVTTDFGANKPDGAYACCLQADGKILVAGGTEPSGGLRDVFALARYSFGGDLDTSFGTSGKVVTELSSGSDAPILCVAVQPDGRIVAGGGPGNNVTVARYMP